MAVKVVAKATEIEVTDSNTIFFPWHGVSAFDGVCQVWIENTGTETLETCVLYGALDTKGTAKLALDRSTFAHLLSGDTLRAYIPSGVVALQGEATTPSGSSTELTVWVVANTDAQIEIEP